MRITQQTKENYNRNLMAPGQEQTAAAGRGRKAKKNSSESQIQNGRIFAGKLSVADPIEAKRKEAQKKALKIVKDAFTKEKEIDQSIEELKDSAEKADKEMFSNQDELQKIAKRREEIAADQTMTEEERTEATKELDKAEEHFTRQLRNQKNVKEGALGAVKGIELSRLKSAPIVDATKSADKVLENASKEVIGMLMDEAKEHIETEQEEKTKEAEEKKAKEKELEEKIEAMKAKKEEKKEASENPELDAIEENTAQLLKTMQVKDDVQKELQGVVKQMKLSLEDIKGAAVDEKV